MAVDQATKYLSKELGVDVSIGDIELSYFDALTASEVYLEDQQGDTLFYIEKLHADYDLFTMSAQNIHFDNVALEDAKVYIGIPKNEEKLNLQFLIDYFTPPLSGKPRSTQTVLFDKVTLDNVKFHYFNKNYTPPSSRAFDENDMVYTSLTGHLHDFEIINDSLTFVIDDISGREKSGLDILNLKAKTIISSTTMEFADLEIRTPRSTIHDYLRFDYSSYADFSDFIEVVEVKANFNKTSIHSDDLALFSNSLTGFNDIFHGEGEVSGTIENLKSRDIQLDIGSHTSFIGAAELYGLPDIYTTRLNIKAKRFISTSKDLAKLIDLDPVPAEFSRLGDLSYSGTFLGYLDDFTAKGKASTTIGDLSLDVSYSQKADSIPAYSGTLQSDNLNLKSLLDDQALGTTSFDLSIRGKGLSASTLTTTLSGSVHHFGYANYDYKNIRIDGNVADQLFTGDFNITDPSFNFDFTGILDIRDTIPSIGITTNVTGINLKTLGLDSADNFVQFTGDINLTGDDIDNLSGSVVLDSFRLINDERTYIIKNVNLIADINPNNRHYNLTSDLASIDITGDFLPSELSDMAAYMQHIIYPSNWDKPEKPLLSKDINLAINVLSYNPVFDEYLSGLYFDSLGVAINYNQQDGKILSTAKLTNFNYDAVSTPALSINLQNGGDFTPINFGINTKGLIQNDSILFDILNANGYINDGIVNFETTAARDSILDIVLGGRFIYKNDSSMVFFDNSKVNIYEQSWILRKKEEPHILNYHGITAFQLFDFRNRDQILFLDGSLGDGADKVNVLLNNFELDDLNPFIAGFDIQLKGLTNGYIDISDHEGFPIIEADLKVANLMLDEDTLGNLSLLSEIKNAQLAVVLNGKIEGGLLNDMNILGDINFKNKKSPLNLKFITEHSSIKPFEKYLDGLVSDIQGFSATNIAITGPLNAPKLNGSMQLDSLNVLVDYLQTRYTGNATLVIDYNKFDIINANLKDRYGKVAAVTGAVSHRNFDNFLFDIKIDKLQNFEILNTKREDNELFFGTAFVDGNLLVSGPMDDILLQINAKSRKGTEISIPLDNSESSGKLSYVEFINLKNDENELKNTFKSAAGVRMDFNFEVTNDASITLIFDELLGDKIEASGHGNLRMEVNTYGDFNMYGGLTIDRGNYLFTALDLINKYFTVNPGGTLFWDGNPYNAKIDLDAIKREYPIPKTLMTGTGTEEELEAYNSAIPVDCYLKLSGLLFNPEVSFDLKFPSQSSLNGTASSSLNTVIERIKLDQEELNRQVFALLVLGTFVPPSFANTSGQNSFVTAGAANTGINSLSDFASSQLNNWLGQLDTRLQVGVDYQTSYQNEAELILSLKRKFLNDRLEVSGSVDAAAHGSRPYDISINYLISEDGSIKIRGFQKHANDPTLGNITNVTTTGVGLFYRYQFDRFRLRRKKDKKDQLPETP